ncbi:MAG: hypothetical protein AAF790_03515 [Planctomycetota bacterium]
MTPDYPRPQRGDRHPTGCGGVPARRVAAHCAAALLGVAAIIAAGCGGPAAGVPDFTSTAGEPDPVSAGTVVREATKLAEKELRLVTQIVELVESVSDDASARRAATKMNELERELGGRTKRKPKTLLVEMSDAKFEALDAELKSLRETYKEKGQRLGERALAASKRIAANNRVGMGARMELSRAQRGVSFAASFSPLRGGFDLVRRYPRELQVTVVAQHTKDISELQGKLRDLHGLKYASGKRIDTIYGVRCAPVGDPAAFADGLGVGTVTAVDPGRRIVMIEIGRDELSQIAEQRRQRQAEAREKAEQAKLAREEAKLQELKANVDRQQGETRSHAQECLDQLRRIDSVSTCEAAVRAIKKACTDYRWDEEKLAKAAADYREEAGEEYDGQEPIGPLVVDLDAEVKRLLADPLLSAVLAKHFGQGLTGRRLLETAPPFRGYPDPAEDRTHPDYVAANLVNLQGGRGLAPREALKRLTSVEPSSVGGAMRRRVARAIRDHVVESSGVSDEAVRALQAWAGRYSTPILAEKLSQERSSFRKKPLLKAIAKYPTPAAAEQVARLVGEFAIHDEACECLVAMGAVAEDAVMGIAPSDDAKTSLAAVTILGEIGTQKSLDLLKQARGSTNRKVKQAASEATRKIIARTKNAAG